MLQHNYTRELKQRLDTGTCTPPPKELLPHIKKPSPPSKEPLTPAQKSSFPVNNSSQQSLAPYIATPQMPVMDINSNISSTLPPKIRKMRTGLELKPHEVDRIASPANKKKLTKADLEWDEPLQNKITQEAGAALEEMVLMEDVTYPRSLKPAGGKGHPELCGWWDGGKPASAA